MDDAVRGFSLAWPSWCMSRCAMICKNGERVRGFLGLFVLVVVSFLYFEDVFNETVIPLALVGYEMIIANEALRASLAICHLISNKREWNNC